MLLPRTDPDQMSFWEHLQELRIRLIWCILALVLGFGFAYAHRFKLWEFCQHPFLEVMALQLKQPMESLQPFAFTSLAEPFMSLMRISLWATAFLVSPFLFYQLWAFIRPGLMPRERRFAIPFVLATSLCFLGGAAFAYYNAFQMVGGILFQEAARAGLRSNLRVDEYLDLFINTLVGTGLLFELPVLTWFLARLRVVTARGMLRYWRHAGVGIVVAAAFLTPGDMFVSTVFLSAVMMGLYFISILVAWAAAPKKHANI